MRPKTVRLGGISAVCLAFTLGLAACGVQQEPGTGANDGKAPSTVKIGVMGDLTGETSALVIPPKNGAKLAVEQYNKKNPKVKVELVEYDSQAKPEQATSLVNQAIRQDKIVALVGPAFSGESQAVGKIMEQAKLPSVSPSATGVDLAKNGWKYWHRVVANDDAQAPKLAGYFNRTIKPKKAFVLSDQDEYGVGLGDAFEKSMKGEGVATKREKVDADAPNYSSTVTKVKAFNPDVVFFGGYYDAAGKLLKQLRDGGYKGVFSSGDGSVDPQLVQAAGKAQSDNVVISCACRIPFNTEIPELKQFAEDYKGLHNTEPLVYGTEGFDAANAILKAIEGGATNAEDINKALATIDFQGVSKQIKFAENGEIAADLIYVYQVKDGEFSLIGNSEEAEAPK